MSSLFEEFRHPIFSEICIFSLMICLDIQQDSPFRSPQKDRPKEAKPEKPDLEKIPKVPKTKRPKKRLEGYRDTHFSTHTSYIDALAKIVFWKIFRKVKMLTI